MRSLSAPGAAMISEPENVDALAQHLVESSREAGLRGRLCESGLARLKNFDWQKSAETTLNVYRRATHAG